MTNGARDSANAVINWAITAPKLLLVEGVDEVRLFGALAKNIGLDADVQIRGYGGRNALRRLLANIWRVPGYPDLESLGIVMDADDSAASAQDRIRGALSAADLPVPAAPLQSAAGDESPKACYLILPPDGETGALEDVCLASVAEDPAMDCVEDYFDCVERTALGGPRANWASKARVHAFLSSRERPDLRLGDAAENGIWPFDAPAFDSLKAVLRMM